MACGYLDEDMNLDDDEFAASLEAEGFGGLGLSGTGGSWGCGGGRFSFSSRSVYRRHGMITFGEIEIFGVLEDVDAHPTPGSHGMATNWVVRDEEDEDEEVLTEDPLSEYTQRGMRGFVATNEQRNEAIARWLEGMDTELQ